MLFVLETHCEAQLRTKCKIGRTKTFFVMSERFQILSHLFEIAILNQHRGMKSCLLFLALIVFASQCMALSSITTTGLPNGTVHADYSAVIEGSGGCTPYKWAIVSGTLPAGVEAKKSNKTSSLNLTGTPTTAGKYSFTVKLTGCGGHVSEVSYEVIVAASSSNVVNLDWSASLSDNVIGYNVYRSPNAKAWKKLNASLSAGNLYSDLTVANKTSYYYAVTSVDSSGSESKRSAPIKVAVP